MPKISVIIPVYNAENYVKRCLDSIKGQSFTDFEAILVNDGSTDHSLKILEEYAAEDHRFIIVDKPNGGVSSARQAGLDKAKGDYVIHADPDDYVHTLWLEKLYDKIISDQSDMVICDYLRIMHSTRIVCHQQPTNLDSKQVIIDILMNKLWGITWNKLIRREAIIRYNISFDLNISLWEDVLFNCLLLNKGIKVSYIPKTLYYYDNTLNANSFVRNMKPKDIDSTRNVVKKLENLLDKSFHPFFYYPKFRIKLYIFNSKPYDKKKFINTFEEINKDIINEAKAHPLRIRIRALSLCLQGHHQLGRFMYKIINKIKKMSPL